MPIFQADKQKFGESLYYNQDKSYDDGDLRECNFHVCFDIAIRVTTDRRKRFFLV